MKMIIYVSIFVCGIIGSYLPVLLFGAGVFDMISLVGGVVGSIAGVFIGYKIGQTLDL
jgi:hypothetical protein